MLIPSEKIKCKYLERPPVCHRCGQPSWWNGTRTVSSVRKENKLANHVTNIIRKRACCPSPNCPVKSWTVYEEDAYPHRTFNLLIVISAVSMVALGKLTLNKAAKIHLCSRDSVQRWIKWVANLADPKELLRICTKLAIDGNPGGLLLEKNSQAGNVLHLLDRLAETISDRGLSLPKINSGLVSILKDQLSRFGEIFYLTKSSPPLRVDFTQILT